VVTHGKRSALGSTFFEPKVLTDLTTDIVVTKEETFGLVAPLCRYKTDEEALKVANENPHPSLPRLRGRVREGLAAYFYSRDIGRIWRVAEGLEYGIVGINEDLGAFRPTLAWCDCAPNSTPITYLRELSISFD
jgi:succinate-semialdehyde dehydrogenase/glutarate-semialdehyde dehydrogenase